MSLQTVKKLIIAPILFSVISLSFLAITTEIGFKKQDGKIIETVKKVHANEIYPEFICGCCSKPLDPKKICCGTMKQMIDFIDEKIKEGKSKDEIMLLGTREFGFDSLAKKETKKMIRNKLAKSAPLNAPRIAFKKTFFSFEKISQKNGIVSTEFDFENDGKSDLIISKISTSCGCTSASVVYREKEGPLFTMPGHGKENPKNWSVTIAPGEKAKIKVYYDPNAHGKQKEKELPITRTVSIFSNDPVEFEKEIKIELIQVP